MHYTPALMYGRHQKEIIPYSDLQKYWDRETFFVVLALYSSPLKLYNDYEVEVQTVNFNLRELSTV